MSPLIIGFFTNGFFITGLYKVGDSSLSIRIWVMALINELQQQRDPLFHCVPLSMTDVVRRIEEKESGGS